VNEAVEKARETMKKKTFLRKLPLKSILRLPVNFVDGLMLAY
jgi:hypothetical protein